MLAKAIVIGAYAVMTLAVGWLGLRKARTFTDFFLGGRTVGPWMSAFTYAAAYFSAVLFIGFAGKVGWGFGLSGLWIALVNGLVGVLGAWALLGERNRRMSVDLQVTTMPEFLERRYASPFLKLIASLAVFLFLVPYSAAVFIGLSFLFKANFGLDYATALLVMGLFTAFYLVLGGYKSMTMIDVVFGLIKCVGSAVLIVSTVSKAGGLGTLTAGLAAVDPRLTAAVGPGGAWPLFSLIFLTSVAPFAMPQLVQKFYAIKDIENHDEPRAASIFPPEKERVASVMIATLPGAKLFHEGQFDSRKVRLPVFLGRRPAEPIDSDHQAFCRNLLKTVHSSVFGDGNWQLCGRSGWPDNQSYLNLVAWCWKKERDRYFIVINLSDQRSQGRVRFPWEELPGQSWSLTDVFTEAVYERDGREMCDLGLYIDLEPWGFHFFRF